MVSAVSLQLKHTYAVQDMALLQEQLRCSNKKADEYSNALQAAKAAQHASGYAESATANQLAAAQNQKASLQDLCARLVAMCQTSLRVIFLASPCVRLLAYL